MNSSIRHDLKIHTSFFHPVLAGDKTFEIRRNDDRGFQKGDVCMLWEVNDLGLKSNRWVKVLITYVLNYAQKEDYVVFSFKVEDQG